MTENNVDGLHAEFCDFALYSRNLRLSTIKWYKECFKEFKKFLAQKEFVKLSLDSFNTRLINLFLMDFSKRGCKATTVESRRKGLKSFCTYLLNNEIIATDPFIKVPKPKIPKTRRTFLNEDECRQLMKGVCSENYKPIWRQERDKVILGLFIYGGLRRGEIISLLTEHIDFYDETIYIKDAKGAKDRTVALHPTLKIWIEEYIKVKNRRNLNCENLLVAYNKNRPLTPKGIQLVINAAKNLTNITKHGEVISFKRGRA